MLYTNQTLQVKWKSITGAGFSVLNSDKQGGVLSLVLFAVYIDRLLNRLSKNGVGFYMGNNFMGAVAFANDIKLLTPTFKGLTKLISICEKYAEEYDIKFNGTKSKYMVYKGRHSVVYHEDVYVNGEKVEQVTTADHLGHTLSTTDKTNTITAAISSFGK